MRVSRFFLLFVAVALVAAGCASQPVAYVPMAAAPSGIDAMVYGTPAAPPRAPAAAIGYAPAYSVRYAPTSRGLFQSFAPVYPASSAPAATPVYPPPAPAVVAPSYAYLTGSPAAVALPPVTQSAYTLDSGDRLRVVVFGQDGLTNSYAVDASGHIAMPLIGSVAARGATTDELASRISAKLRDGYVRDPHVAVEIEAYRPFFILGEVTAPGQYPYVANMTAETAVAIAGGFGPRAYRQTVVLNRTAYGQPIRMAVPLTYTLRPGDTINVQERWF